MVSPSKSLRNTHLLERKIASSLTARIASRSCYLVRLHGTAIGGAAFADEFLGLRLGRLVIEDHFGSGPSEHPDCRSADAAGASCNESDFGIQSQIHNGYKYRMSTFSRHRVARRGLRTPQRCSRQIRRETSPWLSLLIRTAGFLQGRVERRVRQAECRTGSRPARRQGSQ